MHALMYVRYMDPHSITGLLIVCMCTSFDVNMQMSGVSVSLTVSNQYYSEGYEWIAMTFCGVGPGEVKGRTLNFGGNLDLLR